MDSFEWEYQKTISISRNTREEEEGMVVVQFFVNVCFTSTSFCVWLE